MENTEDTILYDSLTDDEVKDKVNYVNHPNHYSGTKIECIDALDSMVEPYKDCIDATLSWQIVKYIWRHPFKFNPLEDLQKAKWYLDRLINYYSNKC